MRVQLKRIAAHEDGTFGVMLVDGVPFCVTLEEEQGGNKKDTAIPAGKYKVKAYSGTKFKGVFILLDVPGRSAILIHWGNTEDNTAGCILLGKEYGKVGNKFGILRSIDAFTAFKSKVPKEFVLEITDDFE